MNTERVHAKLPRRMERDQALSVTVDEVVFQSGDGRFSVLRGTDERSEDAVVRLEVGDRADQGKPARPIEVVVRSRWRETDRAGEALQLAR